MSKLYERLQIALISHEERPVEVITKQTLDEGLFIVRGRDKGQPAWHYIIVSTKKWNDLKAQKEDETVNVIEFGHLIDYRNKRQVTRAAFCWEIDPPKMLQIWLDGQYTARPYIYDPIDLIYHEDDIRLCTMQRATPNQLLQVYHCYSDRERFHYMQLIENTPSRLARRAGIKEYDRLIFYNGINIENETFHQFNTRRKERKQLPTQMLVCSPATYQYYKTNNKTFYCDLPTVQYLKPVYGTSTLDSNIDVPVISFDENIFCVVQLENNNDIAIVSQSSVLKSPEFTCVNDIH